MKCTTILTPQPDNDSLSVEQFEDYTVTDSSVDTADLVKHVKFESFTYVQLLSDKVSMDKKLNRRIISLSNSFKHKKPTNNEESTFLSRSNSTLSNRKNTSEVINFIVNY